MINIPNFYYRKRKPRPPVAIAPPPQTISVYEVSTNDPPEEGQCTWVFTEAVNVTAIPTGLRVNVGGVWKQPTGMEAPTNPTTQVTVYYATSETLDGKAWSIVAAPTGITEAAEIILPQSGTIIAP